MKRNGYKKLVLIFGAIFCLSVIIVPTVEAASKWAFVKKLTKKDEKALSGIARNVNKSRLIRKLPDAATLSRKLDIPQKMLISPAVRKMTLVGEEVIAHGAFASKMLNKSSMPEIVLKQYSHYGKKQYLNIAESVSKLMTKSRSGIYVSLSKLKGKYKGMNDIINNFHNGKYDNDVFVRTIKRTGKRGMNVLGWLSKHPKLAATGAATAWYLHDPEGFEDALASSGKKLGAFVGESMGNASSGLLEGVLNGILRSLASHSMVSVITAGLFIGLVLLLVISRTFRRLLLFPFGILSNKANAKMDEMEKPIEPRKSSHHENHIQAGKSRKTERANTRTPRNNL